jgi:glycosyltransferase involved in cell wall biosynthesis
LGVRYTIIENRRAYDPVFLAKLIRLIKSERVDFVHAHEFMMNVYGSVAARLAGIPMIGTIHGKVYFTEKRSRIAAYKLAVAMSSRIIAVSEDLKRHFVENVGLKNQKKILTVYNGIDIERYKPSESTEELRGRLGIAPGAVVIGTVGSLFKVKAFDNLIKAAGRLRESASEFRLLIAGEGNERENLRRLIDEMNLPDTVSLLGFRDDIPELLNLFDIYVCSSHSEGLSLSILEAMASARPVVGTRVGGNPELIADGDNGFLAPAANSEALAEKIGILIDSKELRGKMGARSREIVEKKFSLTAMIATYQNLYEELSA